MKGKNIIPRPSSSPKLLSAAVSCQPPSVGMYFLARPRPMEKRRMSRRVRERRIRRMRGEET